MGEAEGQFMDMSFRGILALADALLQDDLDWKVQKIRSVNIYHGTTDALVSGI
jgi:hypothetical protein